MREVVGEGALFTAGGVVFFQEGKQAGPYGQRVRSNDDTEFVSTCIRRYVSSRMLLFLFSCYSSVIQGWSRFTDFQVIEQVYIYIFVCLYWAWSYIVWKSSWKRCIIFRIDFLFLYRWIWNFIFLNVVSRDRLIVLFYNFDNFLILYRTIIFRGNFYIILYIFINNCCFINKSSWTFFLRNDISINSFKF